MSVEKAKNKKSKCKTCNDTGIVRGRRRRLHRRRNYTQFADCPDCKPETKLDPATKARFGVENQRLRDENKRLAERIKELKKEIENLKLKIVNLRGSRSGNEKGSKKTSHETQTTNIE